MLPQRDLRLEKEGFRVWGLESAVSSLKGCLSCRVLGSGFKELLVLSDDPHRWCC